MEKFIEKQLRKLKGVKADDAYLWRSLQEICSNEQNKVFGLKSILNLKKISYSLAGAALAIVLVFVALGPIGSSVEQNISVASLSGDDLYEEVSKADFQIHVQEASYFSESAAKVASVLDEIASE